MQPLTLEDPLMHPTHTPSRTARALLGVALCAALTACATNTGTTDARDPYESFNRSVYRFNEGLDRAILKPVATGYRTVVPAPARTGVSNFFGNLEDVRSFANQVLQLKGEAAMTSLFRVLVNTTFGLGGVLDVATEMRLERQHSDFGLTLGHWGLPSGPYLVLPLLGPSSVRDTAGLPLDYVSHPVTYLEPRSHSYALRGLDIVNTRANLLRAGETLDQAALDRYIMLRDLYLAQRERALGHESADDGRLDDDFMDEVEGDTPSASAPQ